MEIKEYLKNHRLLTDGAMGTYFDRIEQEEYLCSEEANITNPGLIKNIHQEYIEQGAQLLRSNTFTANRPFFKKLQAKNAAFLECELKDLLQAGYRIADEAAKEAVARGKIVFAAASIGPISENEHSIETDQEEFVKQYYEICDALLEAGCENFVMETFPDEYYVLKMAEYIKKKNAHAWILGQFTFMPAGYSSTGFHYSTVLTRTMESGLLDAVGMNCGIGVSHMLEFYEEYLRNHELPEGMKLSALPNCGYSRIIRGKAVYTDSVAYFSQTLKEIAESGVSILGGCCGTSPEYIASISQWIQEDPLRIPVRISLDNEKKTTNSYEKHKNHFYEKMLRGEKVFAVELDPPFDANCVKLMESARTLKGSRTDIITLSDSPLARSRADSLLMAAKVKQETGIQVMPHLSCRDRNRIAIRGGLLGAYLNEIRNVLLLTGDPVAREERDYTKSVFDFNSIKCMRYLKHMNEEMFSGDPFIYGGALNQDGANTEAIALRMKKKMEEGCSYFLTQPVYSDQSIDKLKALKEKTDARILIGIMPIVSYRNAVFMKNEIPGIYVPEDVFALYRPDGDKKEWEEIAVDYSLRMMEKCEDIGAGYYMMTPLNRVHLIKKIMELYQR